MNITSLPKQIQQKQEKRKKTIQKLLLLIVVFTVVFVVSGVLWVIISGKTGHGRFWIGDGYGPKWYETKIIEIRPTYNVIKESYGIWKDLSSHNTKWLLLLQIGCGLFGVAGLTAIWFLIDNKFVFVCFLMILFGLLFNWIDSVIDGKALDYIRIKPEYKIIEYIFLWPASIPYFFQGQIVKDGVMNYPDIIVSLGVDCLMFYALIKCLNAVACRIEIKRQNKIYQKIEVIY